MSLQLNGQKEVLTVCTKTEIETNKQTNTEHQNKKGWSSTVCSQRALISSFFSTKRVYFFQSTFLANRKRPLFGVFQRKKAFCTLLYRFPIKCSKVIGEVFKQCVCASVSDAIKINCRAQSTLEQRLQPFFFSLTRSDRITQHYLHYNFVCWSLFLLLLLLSVLSVKTNTYQYLVKKSNKKLKSFIRLPKTGRQLIKKCLLNFKPQQKTKPLANNAVQENFVCLGRHQHETQ